MIQGVPDASGNGTSENSTSENDALAETVYRESAPTGEAVPAGTSQTRWSMKTPDGSVYGPVDRAELDSWSREGRVSSHCLLKREGRTHWQSALTLYPELTGLQPTPEAARQQTRQMEGESTGPSIYLTEDNSSRPNKGVLICVLAIIGLCMPSFPVVSLIALVFALNERSAMDRGVASRDNHQTVNTGYYLAVAGCVIGGLRIASCVTRVL